MKKSKIIEGNLPGDVTEDEVKSLFAEYGAAVEAELAREGNPDDVSAVVCMELDKTTAQVMGDNTRDTCFRGRKLAIYVPLFLG